MARSAALLPPAIFAILKAYPKDFLYGTVIADVVVGKKFQEPEGESQSWHFVQDLLHLARTPAHRAFIYGYQAHLAADTVAHNEYIPRFIVLPSRTHTLLEMKADRLVDPKVWKRPERRVQMRNDILLVKALEKTRLKFSTNKMLFQGILELSLPRQVSCDNSAESSDATAVGRHRFRLTVSRRPRSRSATRKRKEWRQT